MKLLLMLLFCHVSSPVEHSLHVFVTEFSGALNIPEFMVSSEVDELLAFNCDTDKKTVEAKQDWAKRFLENNPHRLEMYTQQCLHVQPHLFKQLINDDLKQSFNQTGGVYILEISGCEWDNETRDVRSFMKFGYDGEDLLELDMKTLTWIARTPKAVPLKPIWDAQKYLLHYRTNFITSLCPEYLREYVNFSKSSPLNKELPSVSLLQKSPSSPVSCYATGFSPDRAVMFWRKDGEEQHEDVDPGEILPNHDGSFQMSVDLNLSSVAPEDWSRYDCVFHLPGVEDDVVTRLDKARIRTNWVSPSEFPAGAVTGVVVVLLLLLALGIAGLFMWRRLKNGFRLANNSESSSPSDRNSAPT